MYVWFRLSLCRVYFGFDQNNSFFRFSRMFNKQKETKKSILVRYSYMCIEVKSEVIQFLYFKIKHEHGNNVSPNVEYCFISIYDWFKHGRICCEWTLNKNLTNVRIYDCMDLSLCQVHCCKYGEQIKKRPCCHSFVHSTSCSQPREKLYTKCSYDFFLKNTPNHFCQLAWSWLKLYESEITKILVDNLG